MEGIQVRGTKRSGVEAALPGRSAEGQQNPGALLVDSCGAPATPGTEGEENGEQQSRVISELPCEGADARPAEQLAEEQHLPAQMVVEPTRGGGESAVTEEATDSPAPGAAGSYTDAEKLDEVSEKEKSRRSFSTLVKAACSQRSYPY